MKKRAFTLVEAIVSIAILSAIILILSNIYGNYAKIQANVTVSYKATRNTSTAVRSIIEFLRANEGVITEDMITTKSIVVDINTYAKFESTTLHVKTDAPIESMDITIPLNNLEFTIVQNDKGVKLLKIKVVSADRIQIVIQPLLLKEG